MALKEKERAGTMAQMHEVAWLNFDRRRSYEWKLSLGVWTAIAVFIALSLDAKIDAERVANVRTGFYVLAPIVFLIQAIFLFQIKTANACDQARAHHYEFRLNDMVDVDFDEKTCHRGQSKREDPKSNQQVWA